MAHEIETSYAVWRRLCLECLGEGEAPGQIEYADGKAEATLIDWQDAIRRAALLECRAAVSEQLLDDGLRFAAKVAHEAIDRLLSSKAGPDGE